MQNTPKKRDAEATKARILKAAQRAFAKDGYAQAGIREIASEANISSPLLVRYFGSKAGLFEAALTDAVSMTEILEAGKEKLGERLANLFLDPALEITPPAMIALAAAHPDSNAIARRVTEEHVIQPMAEWLGEPNGRERALEMFMLATSFILYSRQLPLMGSDEHTTTEVCRWLANSLQAVVDQPSQQV